MRRLDPREDGEEEGADMTEKAIIGWGLPYTDVRSLPDWLFFIVQAEVGYHAANCERSSWHFPDTCSFAKASSMSAYRYCQAETGRPKLLLS